MNLQLFGALFVVVIFASANRYNAIKSMFRKVRECLSIPGYTIGIIEDGRI